MHIAILTAGGAGMFCGSCMHDNTWARALRNEGAEVTLIPAYTPLRVDEHNESVGRVFLGGVNVYLDYRFSFWRKMPRALVGWLDRPWVLNLASKFAVSNDAKNLGALTLALLEGEAGPEGRQVETLADYFAEHVRADVVCFSNALMAGALRSIKQRTDARTYCILQGDDIFLEDLVEPYRKQALELIRERAREFDGFLVHSAYYRDFMADYLQLPVEKFRIVPLGIDLHGHDGSPQADKGATFTIGYFARVCHQKGLHQLVEAFRLLHARRPNTRLVAAGYLGEPKYLEQIRNDARDLGTAFEYVGSPATHDEKVRFLKSLDVLSVPTVYREPKGLYVLEALANGVPVVQPRHGAFPEMIEAIGGGLLVSPGNAEELAAALEKLVDNPTLRMQLAEAGHRAVRTRYDDRTMARETLDLFSREVRPIEQKR